MYFEDKWRVIYINGKKRMATKSRSPMPDFDGVFFVDNEDMPCTRACQYSLSPGATAHLEAGGVVRSSGNLYSLSPDKK